MTRTLTLSLALLLAPLAGCSDHEHDHAHGDGAHDHDHAAGEDHHAPAPKAAAPKAAAPKAPADAPASGPVPLKLGTWAATLEPTDGGLRLVVTGPDGVLTPEGEARVVLTGVGEDEQRIVMTPSEGAWTGTAKAKGAPGYVAVVSLQLGGQTETGRATWGDVPAPAEHGHDHGGGDHGHDHDGGDHHDDGGDHGHEHGAGDHGHDH